MDRNNVCPFCGELFSIFGIKKHIGIVHLGFKVDNFKENTETVSNRANRDGDQIKCEIEL